MRTTVLWGLIIGLPSLLLLLFLSSCEVSKEEVGFSRIYIYNKSTTNDYDTFTNVDMIKYVPSTMAATVTGMLSTDLNIKNAAIQNFINNSTFSWKNTVAISISSDQSYEILTYDCGSPMIIRVDKSFYSTSIGDNYKRYNFALIDPLQCGIEYQIDFTNSAQ